MPSTILIFMSMFLAFYMAVHATLVYNGKQIAAAAAQDALLVAQQEGGTSESGQAAGETTLGLGMHFSSQDVTVNFDENAGTVTATVNATVLTPFIDLFTNVSATVEGPKERFYTDHKRK